jgi:hypothetical protein
MATHVNATHFFERLSDRSMPPSSESFWTAVFALFMIHLSCSDDGMEPLALWRSLPSGPPWYERKERNVCLPQKRLTLSDLAIEPCGVSRVWPTLDLQPNIAGISPDIVACFAPTATDPFFLLVENKITTGASLNHNQTDAYPQLLEVLKNRHGVSCALWVLLSVGCSHNLYAATRKLETQLTDRFGIVLWEDVFRTMRTARFELPGLNIDDLHQYLDGASSDCKEW